MYVLTVWVHAFSRFEPNCVPHTGSGFPLSNFTAVAQAVKARGWLTYSNECTYPFTYSPPYVGSMPAAIPDAVDIISVDIYGYARNGSMMGDKSLEINKFV